MTANQAPGPRGRAESAQGIDQEACETGARERAQRARRQYEQRPTAYDDILAGVCEHLEFMETPSRKRAEGESDPRVRGWRIAIEDQPYEPGMSLPVRGDTRRGIILAVQERHPGTPDHPIVDVLKCLEQDGRIYVDERESSRCFDAVYRIRCDDHKTKKQDRPAPAKRKPKRRKHAACDRPTSKQTEAYKLYLNGLSYAKVGEQLGISATAAGNRIRRAKAILDAKGRSVPARRKLPTDKRGQETV